MTTQPDSPAAMREAAAKVVESWGSRGWLLSSTSGRISAEIRALPVPVPPADDADIVAAEAALAEYDRDGGITLEELKRELAPPVGDRWNEAIEARASATPFSQIDTSTDDGLLMFLNKLANSGGLGVGVKDALELAYARIRRQQKQLRALATPPVERADRDIGDDR